MSTVTTESAPNVHTKLLFEAGKRAFDIIAAIVLLILFSPVLAYVAYRIKRGSKGPVFFRQIRAGRGNRPFMIYKFRTMYSDADQRGPQITSDDDDRVTPYGLTCFGAR
jgi:lipopolysaccharide/colanic/teichoic acid biosynthesis glycosyltransferase